MRPNYQIMEQDFVSQEQSLELKELGFDEPCLVGYSTSTEKLEFYSRPYITKDSFTIDAPTFSQAFRFFREKYNIVHSIDWMTRSGGEYPSGYFVHLRGINGNILNEDNLIVLNETESLGYEVFPTYEEAELSCLKKLIEMVKNK